jgi:hypothetical protein
VRQIMAEAQPAPIRIKLITQLQGTYLLPDSAKRLAEQLAPGAVRIIQKFVQVRNSCFTLQFAGVQCSLSNSDCIKHRGLKPCSCCWLYRHLIVQPIDGGQQLCRSCAMPAAVIAVNFQT